MKPRAPGFTLVELSLAVILTMIVSLALPPLITQGVNSYVLATSRSRLVHDTRHAMTRMAREILLVRNADIYLAQPTRLTFVDTQGLPGDYGFIAAGTRGTIYRTAIPLLRNVNNLSFAYYDANGTSTTHIPNIRRIAITLTANAPVAGTITLRTEVFPRKAVYHNFQ